MTEQFSKGDRVEYVATVNPSLVGATGTVRTEPNSGHDFQVDWDVPNDTCCVAAIRLRKIGPEFVVGQQVSGDDYKRLPVGSVVESLDGIATKVGDNAWRWGDGEVDPNEDVRASRTLTHLGDGTHAESEDTDDVEPEPLKEGDWVQVWGAIERIHPSGALKVAMGRSGTGTVGVSPDAIVRPAAGQVPPWVKPAQCTSLYEHDGVLVRCTGTPVNQCEKHGAPFSPSVLIWTDAEAYGRVEVSS